MPLTKFKVCPACGEHNPPALLECKKCETDLTGIKVVDEATLSSDIEPTKNKSAASGNSHKVAKVCDCGAVNPPQTRKCSSCGEDISDIQATAVHSLQLTRKVVLRAADDDYTFTFEKPVTIIGREAEMRQYLESKSYVSRKHAKFTVSNDDIYIENMSSTNRTFVNNTLIPSDSPTLLKNGDEIGIGGKLINGQRQSQAAYFVFEVSV